jgi:hypothetical protein
MKQTYLYQPFLDLFHWNTYVKVWNRPTCINLFLIYSTEAPTCINLFLIYSTETLTSRYETDLPVSTLSWFIPLKHHRKIVSVATIYHPYSSDFPLRILTVLIYFYRFGQKLGLSRYHEIRINIWRQNYCWFEL